MDYDVFNVRIDVNACDRTRGCTDTVRESALRVDSGRKIPCRTGESNLRQRRAGPALYRLSYISATSPSLEQLYEILPFMQCSTMKELKPSQSLPSSLSWSLGALIIFHVGLILCCLFVVVVLVWQPFTLVSLRAHLHVVGMLRLTYLTWTNRVCPHLLFCSCVYFFCLYGPFNCIS